MASKRKAFSTIEYPPNSRELADDLSKDELVKRLKMLALAFQKMGQEDPHEQYAPLARYLATETFLEHSSKDVKLLISCCIADVFRIFAPDAPYTDPELLKDIFMFLAKQLRGLEDIGSAYFKRYFYLLENLALVKSFNICLELEENQEIISSLLRAIFDIISEEHSVKVRNYFLDIMSSLITEADFVSQEILDIILCNLVEPNKLINKAACSLAADLILRASKALEPYITNFFNGILVLGKVSESEMSEKTFDLIYELHHISPSILLMVMPQLEFKLKSSGEGERKKVVKLLGVLFSEPSSNLITNNGPLWQSFLGRFNDIDPEVRMLCVKCAADLLVNHPSCKKDITSELAHRQHDTDDIIRLEVVSVIVNTAKKGLEYVNDELLSFVKERCLDKKPKVRLEALGGLGALFRKYAYEPCLDECGSASNKNALVGDVTWMQDCILHAYYRPSMEDKLTVERVLFTKLVPFSLGCEERMKRLLYLYATIDENSVKALHEILKCQSLMRKLTREWSDIAISNSKDQLSQQSALAKCACISRYLPESAKAADELRSFMDIIATNTKVRDSLEQLLSANCQCSKAEELVKQVLSHAGLPAAGSHSHGSIRRLLERVAPVMLDRDAAYVLAGYVVDSGIAASLRRAVATAHLTARGTSSASEAASKLLVALTTFFPELFDSAEMFAQLSQYLRHSDDVVSDATLRIIVNIGTQVKTVYPTVYEGMLPTLLSFARTGSAKQTKHALYCINTICPPADKTGLFTSIFEHAKKCLNAASSNLLTAVIAVGHLIILCPDAPYAGDMKSIVLDTLVKGILMQDKTAGRKVNDSWYADHLVSEETNCKVASMKAIVRWLIAIRDRPSGSASSKPLQHAQSVLRMLHTVIVHNGDLMESGSINKPEMARLRLEAGCCVLRIAQHSAYVDAVTNQQFQSLALLINDACYEVRLRFTIKLQKYLLLMKLPLQYLSVLALAANDPVKERRVQVKQFIDTNVQNRRKYIKTHPPSSNAAVFNILPDYVLPYAVHLLAHDPDLSTYDNVSALKGIRECLWSLMEPLIRDQPSLCSLHRKIFEHIKQAKDNQNPDDAEANKKLYVICDLGLALLQKKASFSATAMAPDSSDPLLPAKLFTKVDKSFSNIQMYLPKEVLSVPVKNEKAKAVKRGAAARGVTPTAASLVDNNDGALPASDASQDGSSHFPRSGDGSVLGSDNESRGSAARRLRHAVLSDAEKSANKDECVMSRIKRKQKREPPTPKTNLESAVASKQHQGPGRSKPSHGQPDESEDVEMAESDEGQSSTSSVSNSRSKGKKLPNTQGIHTRKRGAAGAKKVATDQDDSDASLDETRSESAPSTPSTRSLNKAGPTELSVRRAAARRGHGKVTAEVPSIGDSDAPSGSADQKSPQGEKENRSKRKGAGAGTGAGRKPHVVLDEGLEPKAAKRPITSCPASTGDSIQGICKDRETSAKIKRKSARVQ